MAAAAIRIDQPGHPTQVVGQPDRSRDDLELGLVQLRNADDTGVRAWQWSMLDRPDSSSAAISNPTSPNPEFTADLPGSYFVQLIVNEGRAGEVSKRLAIVRDANGLRVPAVREQNEANYPVAGGRYNDEGYYPDLRALLEVARGLAGGGAGGVDVDDGTTLVAGATTIDLDPAFFVTSEPVAGTAGVTMSDGLATSVFGVPGSAGAREDIPASVDDTFLGRRSGVVDFYTIETSVVSAHLMEEWDFTTHATSEFSTDGDQTVTGAVGGARTFTSAGYDRATEHGFVNGTGLRYTGNTLASDLSTSVTTASRLFIRLDALLGSRLDPRAKYSFEVMLSAWTGVNTDDETGMFLWLPASGDFLMASRFASCVQARNASTNPTPRAKVATTTTDNGVGANGGSPGSGGRNCLAMVIEGGYITWYLATTTAPAWPQPHEWRRFTAGTMSATSVIGTSQGSGLDAEVRVGWYSQNGSTSGGHQGTITRSRIMRLAS